MEHETTIISMATQKGGSGKTMLTHILALALTGKSEGKKVMVIDADPQGSLLLYNKYAKKTRKDNDHKPPYALEACTLENLRTVIKQNYGQYDYIFIDVPGTLHQEGVRAAFLLCDFIFLPVLPDVSDFDAALNTIDVVKEIKAEKQKNDSDLKYYCFLNQAEPNRVSTKMLLEAWASTKVPNVPKPMVRYEKYKTLKMDTVNILDNANWGHEEFSLNVFFEAFKDILNNHITFKN